MQEQGTEGTHTNDSGSLIVLVPTSLYCPPWKIIELAASLATDNEGNNSLKS